MKFNLFDRCNGFKETMLKNNKLNYKIIYPHQIKNTSLNKLVQFL